MKRPRKLDKRFAKRILAASLPSLMLPLVREKVIRAEHLESVEKLLPVFLANLDKGINKWRWSIAIEEEFIQEAVSLWKEEKS
jgi:hypothetical protein